MSRKLSSSSMTYYWNHFVKFARIRKAPVSAVTTVAFGLGMMAYSSSNPPQRRQYDLQVGMAAWPKTQTKLGPSSTSSPNLSVAPSPPSPNECGEDAYVVVRTNEQVIMGVADGVGSWRSKGVDPAQFSRSLMRKVSDIVKGRIEGVNDGDEQQGGILARVKAHIPWTTNATHNMDNSNHNYEKSEYWSMKILLRQAFWRVVRSFHQGKDQPFGSSTACLLALNCQERVWEGCNLGDSGYLILRRPNPNNNKMIVTARSQSQQHRFNAPFQLMLSPAGDINDCSAMAIEQKIPAQVGDVVIVATDGLWDNLFEEDITNCITLSSSTGNLSAQQLAWELTKRARQASEREDYESPFTVEGRRHGINRLGGKVDDITIVVGIVAEGSKSGLYSD